MVVVPEDAAALDNHFYAARMYSYAAILIGWLNILTIHSFGLCGLLTCAKSKTERHRKTKNCVSVPLCANFQVYIWGYTSHFKAAVFLSKNTSCKNVLFFLGLHACSLYFEVDCYGI